MPDRDRGRRRRAPADRGRGPGHRGLLGRCRRCGSGLRPYQAKIDGRQGRRLGLVLRHRPPLPLRRSLSPYGGIRPPLRPFSTDNPRHSHGATMAPHVKRQEVSSSELTCIEEHCTVADNNELNVNSFFAGIGGFDLGFENKGFTNTFICENNEFCNEVLGAHWPDVPKFGDINEVPSESIPSADVWCGGFPCQDISVARGSMSRLGLKGSRSGLFYRFAELIGDHRPQVVLIENVAGLFNSNSGNGFGCVLSTLNDLGYGVAWRLLNSRYFGVPQSRPRVYLCCWKGNPNKAMRVMFEDRVPAKPGAERAAFITESTPKGKYPRVPTTGYCLAATSGRHTGTDWSRTYVTCSDGVRRLTPIECERLQGFPDN